MLLNNWNTILKNPLLSKKRQQKPHKRGVLFCLLAFILASSVQSAMAKNSDLTIPYHFTSRSMSYNSRNQTLIYRGNVIIKQGTTIITGNKVILDLAQQNKTMKTLIAYGKPAHYSTLPDNKPQKIYANANKIIYNPNRKIAILIGNAKVSQGLNYFTGPKIWYDMQNGVIHTYPTNKKHKTVIFINQPSTTE